jgi:site-specific recombinase XerD
MSVKTILFHAKKLKNGESPVMLYIYEEGKKYYHSLGYSCLLKNWDESSGRFRKSAVNGNNRNLLLRKHELRASEIIDDFVREGKRFNIDEFKRKFNGIGTPEKSFYDFCSEMIEEKKAIQKIGTSLCYKDALRTMHRFDNRNVKFTDVNYAFLKGLETFLLSNGCTNGGVAARFRSIKALYYEGVRRNYVDKNLNPFSTSTNRTQGYSLSKLKSTRNPKALSEADMTKLKSFNHWQYPKLQRSYLYFMFSYYMYGMNMADISTLTKNNIIDGRCVYRRQKTGGQFNLKINEQGQVILNFFKSDSATYLFPIYTDRTVTAIQKKNKSMKVLKRVNSDLKLISRLLNLDNQNFSFYTARHTFATTLKMKGVSTDIISESLGHSNLTVTQNYLRSFENEVIDRVGDML